MEKVQLEPLLIATDDPLVFVTPFKGALTVACTKRIVDQLSEGAALLIGLKILADHLEAFFRVSARVASHFYGHAKINHRQDNITMSP